MRATACINRKSLSGKPALALAIGGVPLAGRRPERIRQAGVAIVPEGRRLLPDLTAGENIRAAAGMLLIEQFVTVALGLAPRAPS